MIMFPPAVRAALAVCDSVNANAPATLPSACVGLAPRVCESNDGELEAVLYIVPTSSKTDRNARGVLRRALTVSLVALIPVESEEDAKDWLGELQEAADAVLAEGARDGVKFLNADASELYDQQLLAEQGVLRAQIDIDCLIFEESAR